MLNVEYNIKKLTVEQSHKIEEIAKRNGLEVTHNGWDRLVLIANDYKSFFAAVDKVVDYCKFHGINYSGLLNLD